MLASETDADGHTTSYTYDAYGNKASETDPDGNVTDYTYDGAGDLLTTTLENYTGSPPGSQAAAPLEEEARAYDPAGRLAWVSDAMGRGTEYYYTDNGLLARRDGVQPGRVAVVQARGEHLRRRRQPDRAVDEQRGNRPPPTPSTPPTGSRSRCWTRRPGPHHQHLLHPGRPAGVCHRVRPVRRDAVDVVHLRPERQRDLAVGDPARGGRPGRLVPADADVRHQRAGLGQRRAAGHRDRRDLERQRRRVFTGASGSRSPRTARWSTRPARSASPPGSTWPGTPRQTRRPCPRRRHRRPGST